MLKVVNMFESIQAKIVAFTVVVLLISATVSMLRDKKSVKSIMWGVFGILIAALYFLIIIIDQNCVVIGGCDFWGWIKMVLTEIWLIFAIIVVIASMFENKAQEEKKDDQPSKSLNN